MRTTLKFAPLTCYFIVAKMMFVIYLYALHKALSSSKIAPFYKYRKIILSYKNKFVD